MNETERLIVALLGAGGIGALAREVFKFLTSLSRSKERHTHDEREYLSGRDRELWKRVDEIDESRKAEIAERRQENQRLREELGSLRDENTILRANLEAERQKNAQLHQRVLEVERIEQGCIERVRQLEKQLHDQSRTIERLETWRDQDRTQHEQHEQREDRGER